MSDPDTPVRRTVVAVDVHQYSSARSLQQVDIQETLIDVLDTAATLSGLDRSGWYKQAQGDAEVAVLPADAPEPVVVADLVQELTNRLARVNHVQDPALRLRLRVAVHSGMVHFGRNGLPGPAAVQTCRLLDSSVLKRALASSDADLALIVSDALFRDIVEPGYRGLRAVEFTPVEVRLKEFTGTGHVRLLGGPGARTPAAPADRPARPGDEAAPAPADGREPKAARPGSRQEIHAAAVATGEQGVAIGRDQHNHYGSRSGR
ncbi:hypothetical protein [Actinomadura nitritigenes]|uniref:hypothetical protein n=1 Tax=Actinomadura nitritigenes TaxID=134602 RepID=UPI003D8C4C4B